MARKSGISMKQIQRYPVYLKYLLSLEEEGVELISSPQLAKGLSLNEEQVRKDLQYVSSNAGKPRQGREIKQLIQDIEEFLCYNNTSDAVVIGVGSLGEAFMKYAGFSEYGLNIIAGFDVNEFKVGTSVGNKPIFHLDKFENLAPRLGVKIAILTIPAEVSEEVTKTLIKGGIKGIWNFTPVHLNVPEGIVVENVNLASSLAVLSHKLSTELSKEK